MRPNFNPETESGETVSRIQRAALATGLRLVLILALLSMLNLIAVGQTAPARPDRGTIPGGSYSISDIENVNMTNGNVGLSIPLASLPPVAGGKLTDSIRAVYNSKLWDVKRKQVVPDPLNPSSAYQTNQMQLANAGWVIDGGYSIVFSNSGDDFEWQPLPNDPENEFLTSHIFVKCILYTPDGSQHELRPVDYSEYTDPFGNHPNLKGYFTDYPGNKTTPMRYYSYDGSFLWATIDPMSLGLTATSWIVYMPDGSSVALNIGLRKMRDGLGNRINVFQTEDVPGIFTTHHVDNQTLREIQFVTDMTNPIPIGHVKYQTVQGGWVTTDITLKQTSVIGHAYWIGDAICPEAALLADTNFITVDKIVLPQTEPGILRQFTFTYSCESNIPVNYTFRYDCSQNQPTTITSSSRGMGSLSTMELPTGAFVDYSYLLDIDVQGLPTVPLNDANDAARDGIVKKTIRNDGISDVWNYAISSGLSSVSGPDGFVNQTFYPRELWAQHLYGGLDGKGGLVYRTNRSNKVITERHWIHNSFGLFPGSPAQATGAAEAAAFNPTVDYEYTTLLDQNGVKTKLSTKAMQYDFNGNLQSVTEYDFVNNPDDPNIVPRDAQNVPIGIPVGAVALRTTTNTYYNAPDSGTSPNIYALRLTASATPRILSAPRTSVTGPSQSEFYYDGNLDLDTAPSAGNLTKERHWEGTKWIQTLHSYDPTTSNLTSTTDPSLNVIQYFYDATKALPSSVVVDPLNGTGTQTTSTVYDFSTGLPLSVTDANGKTSSTSYTNQLLGGIDPFGRPGVVTDPQLRTAVSRYRDSMQQVEVWSDLNTAGDAKLRTRTTADKLGRPVKSESAEDGVNYAIFADTVYQQMGKIIITTNPMRSAAANTDGWTRTTKDDIGRVITVETFSGRYPSGTATGTVTTNYDAHATTVTDQASKVRRSIVDGLGRLVRVDEPTAAGLGTVTAPNQPTSYTYDSRGNLTQVSQGGQTRTFVYDALSRLKQATNPESGTVNYTYYDNSNLLTRTDARSTVTTYVYDGLNRVTSRTYSGPAPGGTTPAVTYVYDSLGVGLNGKGRLTSVSSSVSSYSYGSYDVMGRVVTGTQSTDGQNYNFSYQYNLAGGMTSETYPSGRVVATEYDSAGRIAGVKNQSTGAYWAGATPTDAVNRFQYAAHGAVSVMKLGNSRWEHTNYNSRFEQEQKGIGTSSTDSSTLRLDYTYGTTNNNGNVQTQRIVAGSLDVTQNYTYDELNRLATANENSGANWSQTYRYDRWGNRWVSASSGYTLNPLTPTSGGAFNTANNRLVAPSAYDTAGNLTADSQGRSFEYDGENRQTKFNNTAGLYFYDGDGRRVKKTDINGTTVFVYNVGGQLIAEYHNDPVPPGAGGGGTSYLTTDHLGSTRVVTKADGSVKARYDYLPFGEELGSGIGGRTVAMGYSAVDSTKQKFTQKERDIESGLDYFLARYYSSVQGRFMSPDTVAGSTGNPQSLNLFAYVANNPLALVDPTGHFFMGGFQGLRDERNPGARPEEKQMTVNEVGGEAAMKILTGKASLKEVCSNCGYLLNESINVNASQQINPEITPLFAGVASQLARSENASLGLIGGFAGVTGAAGTGIGGLAYITGTALAGGGITTLGLSEGGSAGFDLALGLESQLPGLVTEMSEAGLNPTTYIEQAGTRLFIPENFNAIAAESRSIHFAVRESFDFVRYVRFARDFAAGGGAIGDNLYLNSTNYELYKVLSDYAVKTMLHW